MTTKSRRSSRRRTTRSRTGRNVWVNVGFNIQIVQDTIASLGLLGPAGDFMTFDTTIVETIMTDLQLVGDKTGLGNLETRWALQTAPSTMDSDDFEPMLTDSIGPPWMYVAGLTARITDGIAFTMNYGVPGGIRAKAKRRFRENDATLFLVFQNAVAGGTALNMRLTGMSRTLIHIP